LGISLLPARYFEPVYHRGLPGKPLPAITNWVLASSSFPTTFILELVVGVLFFGLFLFLDCGNDQRRARLIPCLTAALTLSWLQLLIVLVALALPFIPIID
jgi:hypothetical protein